MRVSTSSNWLRACIASLLSTILLCSSFGDRLELLQRAEEALRGGSRRERRAVAVELASEGYRDPNVQGALAGDPALREKAYATLRTLKEIELLPQRSLVASPSQEIARILRDPVFAPPPEGRSLLEWLGERLLDFVNWLGRLGSRLAPPTAAIESVFAWIGIVAAAAFFGVGLALAFVRGRWGTGPARATPQGIEGTDEYRFASCAEWSRLAKGAIEKADWSSAVRYSLLASLARLDEAGVIRHEPGRTNGEYVRSVIRHGGAQFGSLSELAAAYDRVWYGSGIAGSEEATRAWRCFEELDGACGRRGQ